MRKRVPYADPCWFAEFSNNRRFYGCHCEKVSFSMFWYVLVCFCVPCVRFLVYYICIYKYRPPQHSNSNTLAFAINTLDLFRYWQIFYASSCLCMYLYMCRDFIALPPAVIKPHHFIFVTPELLRTILRK